MRKLLIYLAVCLSVGGCTLKGKHRTTKREVPDFVIDSTLTRMYRSDKRFTEEDETYPPGGRRKVLTAEEAYNIAMNVWNVPELKELVEGDKPFKINLLDDSIWIVHGMHDSAIDGLVWFGGELYTEIRKQDGLIMIALVGE